ncbi:MAG: putative proteasome accessory factor, partial [Actinomycetota bacterium]
MINLLALLVERSRPLTLKQIRRELGNQYSEQDEAARAAFERDKSELRKMGIPIEMVTLGGDQAGEGGYTVDRRSFLLADLKLTDEERSALELAIATVRMGALVGEGALWKLGGERVAKTPTTSVNIQMTDDVLVALASGVVERKTLTFTYKSEQRKVDPYGLLARGGFWYLVGHDHLRGMDRLQPSEPAEQPVLHAVEDLVDQLRADRLDPALATILDPQGAAAARYQALARAHHEALEAAR